MKKTTYLVQRKRLLALLRETRTKASLTHAELASRLHQDQTFVSKYETGERRLDILELRIGIDFKQFIRALDTSEYELLKAQIDSSLKVMLATSVIPDAETEGAE